MTGKPPFLPRQMSNSLYDTSTGTALEQTIMVLSW
jgi:hypothetical protein